MGVLSASGQCTFEQKFKLRPASTGAVAIYGDVALVGTDEVHVYDFLTGVRTKILDTVGPSSGFAIAIDSDIAVIGDPYADHAATDDGRAQLFNVQTGNHLATLAPADPRNGLLFGWSVAISGSVAIVGAPSDDHTPGAAYLFDVATGSQLAKLLPNDIANDPNSFGRAVAIDGDIAVVGDPFGNNGVDGVYLFDVNSGQQLEKIELPVVGDWYGRWLSINGDTILIGNPYDELNGERSGNVYVFETSGAMIAELRPSDAGPIQKFGVSVSLSDDLAVIGAEEHSTFDGAAYVFRTDDWTQVTQILPNDRPNDGRFGIRRRNQRAQYRRRCSSGSWWRSFRVSLRLR